MGEYSLAISSFPDGVAPAFDTGDTAHRAAADLALAAAVPWYILSAEPLPAVDVAAGGVLFASTAIRTSASCWLAYCVGCGVVGGDRCCRL